MKNTEKSVSPDEQIIINQPKKPEGEYGKKKLEEMNSGRHVQLADWSFEHFPEIEPGYIAELGCGGGRNAFELLNRYPDAKLNAVDYSPLSVETAKEFNKEHIAAGRCEVMEGDVSHLSLESGKYGLATAFETIYFWPGLADCFKEVARILKPGGYFVIVNESDGTDELGKAAEEKITGMKVYTPEEIIETLKAAGFSEACFVHHPEYAWITVVAKK